MSVPEGWKLVPVELTEEMADAVASRPFDDTEEDTNISFYGGIFKAMLSAAPAPPGVEPVASALFGAIKHGDEKHQEWLRNAINEFYALYSQPSNNAKSAS